MTSWVTIGGMVVPSYGAASTMEKKMTNIRETYIKWLDDKILEHQTEVARLTVARDVLLEMPTKRLEGAVKRQTYKGGKKTSAESNARYAQILNRLSEGPMRPVALMESLGVSKDQKAKKPYYNALDRLVARGTLVKDDGVYRVSGPPVTHN